MVNAILLVLLLGGIAIPFIFVEKLINGLAALALLVIMGVAYRLMQLGRVRFAAELFVGGMWFVFTGLISLSGGMNSVMVVFYLLGTVITGLLLGARSALIYIAACCLAGLGMVIYPLPRLLPVKPIAGWVDMAVALICTTILLRYVLNSLSDLLALTRQNLEEHRQAGDAIRESEERLSRLSMASTEGIGITIHGKIVDANSQLAIMLGYDLDELIGLNANDFVTPEARNLVNAFEQAGSEGVIEHLALKRDGAIFPVETRSRTILYKGAQARVTIIRDITERKLAEEKLESAYNATLEGWSRALDLRDRETEGHTQRVTEMAVRLAKELGLEDSEILQIRRGALLHDIGKMGIPDAILLKPGPLTGEEMAVMHRHPAYAFRLLEPIQYLRPALTIPADHHERWDGSGYPLRPERRGYPHCRADLQCGRCLGCLAYRSPLPGSIIGGRDAKLHPFSGRDPV